MELKQIRVAALAAALIAGGAGMAFAQSGSASSNTGSMGAPEAPSTGTKAVSPGRSGTTGAASSTTGSIGVGGNGSVGVKPRAGGGSSRVGAEGNAAPGQPGSTPESKPPAGN